MIKDFWLWISGDRYLINQSASNGIIYALSSSGIIGLNFLHFIFINIFKFSLKNIILKNSFKNVYLFFKFIGFNFFIESIFKVVMQYLALI